MAMEICGYAFADGSICDGLYDPAADPPIPCIFPDDPLDDLIQAILTGSAEIITMIPAEI